MTTEAYILDISHYDENVISNRYGEISSHFISDDGETLSKRKESLCGKLLLWRTLKQRGLGEFEVHYRRNLKPLLKNAGGLRFNISHSGKFVVLALSEGDVGCDIQEIRPYNPGVARKNYCDNETALIESSEDRDSAFIRLWALKESILKFTGEGIAGGLKSYDFSPYAENEFSAFGCSFYVKKIENTYFALCHKAEEFKIKTADLNPEGDTQ